MPADLRRPDADSGETDDWLGDEAAIDWDEEATESAPAVVAPHAPPDAAPIDAATLRRRRLLALAALVALIAAGVGIAIAVAGGGDGSSAETTDFTATTVPTTQPTTTPPATTAQQTTPAAPTVKLPASGKLQRGDTGTEVTQLQRALKTLGFDVGTPDGSFGTTTETAVAA